MKEKDRINLEAQLKMKEEAVKDAEKRAQEANDSKMLEGAKRLEKLEE